MYLLDSTILLAIMKAALKKLVGAAAGDKLCWKRNIRCMEGRHKFNELSFSLFCKNGYGLVHTSELNKISRWTYPPPIVPTYRSERAQRSASSVWQNEQKYHKPVLWKSQFYLMLPQPLQQQLPKNWNWTNRIPTN